MENVGPHSDMESMDPSLLERRLLEMVQQIHWITQVHVVILYKVETGVVDSDFAEAKTSVSEGNHRKNIIQDSFFVLGFQPLEYLDQHLIRQIQQFGLVLGLSHCFFDSHSQEFKQMTSSASVFKLKKPLFF